MLARKSKVVLQSESGVVLLLVMILMVVFSLLTLAMFDLLKTSTQISGNHKRDLRTIYIADAGAEDAIKEWLSALQSGDLDFAVDADNPVVIGPTPFAGGTYTTTIKYAGIPSTPTFHSQKDIYSTGTLDGLSRTIVVHVKSIQIGSATPGNYAIATTSWKLQ